MTREVLTTLIFVSGFLHLCIFVAQALVPFRLNWRTELAALPTLHRQMYFTYGGYVVLATGAFAVISMLNAAELASGSPLARSICAYVAIFWGVRFVLQFVFDAKAYLTTWWLKAGYYLLSVLFLDFALLYGIAAFRP